MEGFSRGRRLCRAELRENMHVVLHRCDKGLLVDTDAEAVVEDDHTFNRVDSGGTHEFRVKRWDGDTIIHAQGKRFEVYELVRSGQAAAT